MNKEQTLTGVIRGTGACVPKRVMDNDEIAGFVETSDEWIRERTGVERRHIAEEETTVSMAVEAGRQAVEEITSFCHGTLLNTGVPDIAKIQACILAGQKANALGHPVVLDPVGAGASTFRRKELQKLLQAVHPTAVRCNQEEAVVLCSLLSDTDSPEKHGGVESSLQMAERDVCLIAGQAASLLNCTVLITGKEDVVSDGKQTQILTGGDSRIRRITGGGCMLSALCTLFLCTDTSAFDAVRAAGALWRETALEAGRRTDAEKSGIGSFHVHLFDVLEEKLMYTSKHKF